VHWESKGTFIALHPQLPITADEHDVHMCLCLGLDAALHDKVQAVKESVHCGFLSMQFLALLFLHILLFNLVAWPKTGRVQCIELTLFGPGILQ
jgi:hypothetical protein